MSPVADRHKQFQAVLKVCMLTVQFHPLCNVKAIFVRGDRKVLRREYKNIQVVIRITGWAKKCGTTFVHIFTNY